MSQSPNKRNKDSKEVAEKNIEKPIDTIDNEDATLAVEEGEVAGQRDTKSGDAASSADSVII